MSQGMASSTRAGNKMINIYVSHVNKTLNVCIINVNKMAKRSYKQCKQNGKLSYNHCKQICIHSYYQYVQLNPKKIRKLESNTISYK